jgi:hypothetical protein
MNLTKITFSTLGAAALVLAGAGSANAGVAQSSGAVAAAAPGSLCEIQVSRVKALDLQENAGDEIRLKIGDKTSVTRPYTTAGQVRNVLGDNTYDLFTSPEVVKVVEVDGAVGQVVGSAASIPCVHRGPTKSLVSDATGDTIYEVTWYVNVLVP